MKTLKEVQKAHDSLVMIILGDVPNVMKEEEMVQLRSAASVLCWVLEHEHNPTFGKVLEYIEDELRKLGYVLEDTSN
jgi:hypothetical protein